MRGADCNSDHRLLRVKFVVGIKKYFKRTQCAKVRCSDQGELTAKGRNLVIVDETLQTTRNDDGTIQEKWNTLKSALYDGAYNILIEDSLTGFKITVQSDLKEK